ncbi:hypothetical protein GCM10011506_35240 [Marivirga lumbricoides]|uniref:Uncharacterized protein n=1 Tax=Marivirga lumbricoides TaxID=1046115 RepID=A0ABQ1MWW8_9BACT|nr:hypothetical protein GCM10011506_35240 [Marivirga lumbricoides]
MLTYLGQEKVFSCKLAEEPVQIAIEGFNVFVLTNPYPVEIKDNQENEEALPLICWQPGKQASLYGSWL